MARTKGAKDKNPRQRRPGPEGYKRSAAMQAKADAQAAATRAAYEAVNPGWRERLAEFNRRIMANLYKPITGAAVTSGTPEGRLDPTDAA